MPVFTEVLGYGSNIAALKEGNEDAQPEEDTNGYESEDEDDTYGVEGMSM